LHALSATCSLAAGEVLLELCEELGLLELLVVDDRGVGVVGEVGGPGDEGGVVVRDSAEVNLALDGGSRVSGLSGEHLVAERVLDLRELGDAELPLSAVRVLDGNDGVKLVGAALGEGGGLDDAWDKGLKLEALEEGPGLVNGDRKHAALDLVGGHGH